MTQQQPANLKDKVLGAASSVFNQTGYASSDLKQIAQKADLTEKMITQEYSDKEALCAAWLSDIHQRSEDRHDEILASNLPALEKIKAYFDHLEEWTVQHSFSGCPFTNTANSLGSDPAEEVKKEIKQHKHYVCDFFVKLSLAFTGQDPKKAEWLGRKLFLLYSAATTEAKNMRELWPIHQASQLAFEACQHALQDTEKAKAHEPRLALA